jgi:hypothetical protein
MTLAHELAIARMRRKALENVRLAKDPILNPYGIIEDFDEFAASCRIRSGPDFVPFNLFNYQSLLNRIINQHEGTIIIKDRQLGITEVLAVRILQKMLLNPAYLAAFISINQDKSSEVSDRVASMPRIDGLKWDRKSGKKLKPMGCGESQYLPSTDNAARSLPSIIEFFGDEAAFISNFEEIYGAGTSAQEMVDPEHRKMVLCSTIPPDGDLSDYWAMFDANNGDVDARTQVDKARAGESNCGIPGVCWWTDAERWAKVVIGHKAHPKYGAMDNYIESVMQRRKIPRAIAEREHNLGLDAAQGSLFNGEAVKRQATGQWVDAAQGGKYLVGCDPNFSSSGGDFFVIQAWRIDTSPFQLVYTSRDNTHSSEWNQSKLIEAMDRYKPVITSIERNSGGTPIAEAIIKARPRHRVETVITTRSSKLQMTDRIALAVEQGQVVYPKDWVGITEMQRFSAAERKATGSAHDDEVMAFAIAFAYLDEALSAMPFKHGKGKVRF